MTKSNRTARKNAPVTTTRRAQAIHTSWRRSDPSGDATSRRSALGRKAPRIRMRGSRSRSATSRDETPREVRPAPGIPRDASVDLVDEVEHRHVHRDDDAADDDAEEADHDGLE